MLELFILAFLSVLLSFLGGCLFGLKWSGSSVFVRILVDGISVALDVDVLKLQIML